MGFGTNSLTTYGNKTYSEIRFLTGMKMGDTVYNTSDKEIMHFTGSLWTVLIGSTGSTSVSNLVPTRMVDDFSWSAIIMESTELAGISGGINSLQFLTGGTNTPVSLTRTNQKIFIGHVTGGTSQFPSAGVLENVDTYSFVADFVEVFDGSINWKGGQWNTIELDTAFNYNGTDGIIIKFEDRDSSGTGSGVGNYITWHYTDKTYSCAYNSQNTTYPSAPTNGVRTSVRPVMRIMMGGANNSSGGSAGFREGTWGMSKGCIAKNVKPVGSFEPYTLGNARDTVEDGAVTRQEGTDVEKAIFVSYWRSGINNAILCIQSGITSAFSATSITKDNYIKPDTGSSGELDNSGTSGASGDVGIACQSVNIGQEFKAAWSFTERL